MPMPMDTVAAYLSLVSSIEQIDGIPGMTAVVLITGQVVLYLGTRMVILDPVEDVGCAGIDKVQMLMRDAGA